MTIGTDLAPGPGTGLPAAGPGRAFWIDHAGDRCTCGEASRYRHFVRARSDLFGDAFESHDTESMIVRFAVEAWTTATHEAIGCGYVRMHPRIIDARLARDGVDGDELRATVAIAADWPAELRDDGWQQARTWTGWDESTSQYKEPDALMPRDTGHLHGNLTAGVQTRFRLRVRDLPSPDMDPDTYAEDAAAHIDALVAKMNRVVDPILQRFEDTA